MAGIVKISVLPNIKLINPITKEALRDVKTGEIVEDVSWAQFIGRLLNTPAFVQNFKGLQHQLAILRALEALTPESTEMSLAKDDWATLRNATEFPAHLGWSPICFPCLEPMFSSVRNPTEV